MHSMGRYSMHLAPLPFPWDSSSAGSTLAGLLIPEKFVDNPVLDDVDIIHKRN